MPYIYHTESNRRIGPDHETPEQAQAMLQRLSSVISPYCLAVSTRNAERPELAVVKS